MKKLQLNLCKLRKTNKLTQRDLSERLGVSFQTVSKWENGNSMPDIALLPLIAEIYKISIDQLLGVVPIEYPSYTKRIKDSAGYRDKILEQFTSSIQLYWNDDYLEFILKKVWKISSPVKICELNCGNGIFAKQLLKYLPLGTTYDGYEKSDFMRADGINIFCNDNRVKILPFEKTKDIRNKYDIVLCQGYLRHHNNPLEGISLMISMAKVGGLVAGHEENRPFENAGLILGEENDYTFEKGLFLDKIWNHELIQEGRDYRMGLRLPLLLKKAGLVDINCRMNDHIDLLLGDEKSKELIPLLKSHYRVTSINENNFMAFLMERGLTRYEALRYIELFDKRKSYMNKSYENLRIVHCLGLLLSWGKKKH